MNAAKRNRARVLTPEGLKKLQAQVRSHEDDHNWGKKYTLERLGELTGLDPETVKNVLEAKGSDKRPIARCFETFGLTLTDSDHVAAAHTTAATPDPNFVGRAGAIGDLDTLVSQNARVIVIQARGGVGKTTLARKYLSQKFGPFLEFPIAKETKDIASIEALVEEKLRQLGEEPGREFLVSLDRLKRKLQTEAIGILIDNLEPALDGGGKLIAAHRGYVELLRVLADPTVRSLTLITTRERLREPAVTVQHYTLRSLDASAWEQFFQSRSLATEESVLAALHHAYGGNAKAMDIVSGAILEDFGGDGAEYWRVNQDDLLIERDLEDLVTQQFDRLQQLDPDAYKLLCRMGCYRYQDVPTVPIEGLFCLLWNVPENRHRRVIKSLQDRSLVDCENGEFWLHPVVREEAIVRLRVTEDWEIANRKSAKFWTEATNRIDTIQEAFIAFEAYHHYLQINELERASQIIVGRRLNRNDEYLCLGGSFYRLGLTQQISIPIKKVLPFCQSKLVQAEMYSTLGDANWFNGSIEEATKCQEKAEAITIKYLEEEEITSKDYYLATRIRIYSLVSRGVYKTGLWLFDEALSLLENSIELSKSLASEKLSKKALFFISFIKSHTTHIDQKARTVADQLYREFFVNDDAVKINWFYLWHLASTYKNLGNLERALEISNRILLRLDSSDYNQGRAKTLLGIAEIYRKSKSFEMAVSLHLESINLLDEIGAKFDLAESHYQIGLTYQIMGEIDKSDKGFQEAIRLFTEMEAPKQVERVRKSMQLRHEL
jgi:tetratricopeptide (TPR) repeat protein